MRPRPFLLPMVFLAAGFSAPESVQIPEFAGFCSSKLYQLCRSVRSRSSGKAALTCQNVGAQVESGRCQSQMMQQLGNLGSCEPMFLQMEQKFAIHAEPIFAGCAPRPPPIGRAAAPPAQAQFHLRSAHDGRLRLSAIDVPPRVHDVPYWQNCLDRAWLPVKSEAPGGAE